MSTAHFPCELCKGTGKDPSVALPTECPICHGLGYTIPVDPDPVTMQIAQRYPWAMWAGLVLGLVLTAIGTCIGVSK